MPQGCGQCAGGTGPGPRDRRRCSIVPQAILSDLANGGDKNWGDVPYPTRPAGASNAGAPSNSGRRGRVRIKVHEMKGGFGSASIVDPVLGTTVGVVAVNSIAHLIPEPVFQSGLPSATDPGLRPDGIPRPDQGRPPRHRSRREHNDRRYRYRCPNDEGRRHPFCHHGPSRSHRAIRPAHTPLTAMVPPFQPDGSSWR